MHLDSSLCRTKISPWKQRETQINRRAVQRVNGICEIKTDVVIDVKFACAANQDGGNVRPYAPVSSFVRVGQRRPCNGLAQAHSVKLRWLRPQARLDIALALSIRHLRKRHYAKLFATAKTTDTDVAAMTSDDPVETRPRHEVHDLRKPRPAKVHGSAPPFERNRGNQPKITRISSNRHHTKLRLSYCCYSNDSNLGYICLK